MEHAYDNLKIAEDVVRDVALRLNAQPRVAAYVVDSENFESIHNHAAYAIIERDKQARSTLRRVDARRCPDGRRR